ncbi:chemotaxis protein CheX [Cohnella endophytica]|nr:chemotaxis protein CheX [Cohnella endophytica]
MLNEFEVITKVGENVLKGYLGLNAQPLRQQEQQESYIGKDIGVIIQLVGQMDGQVICTMNLDTVKSLIGRMMGGLEIGQLDDMCWSALQEFGNWIVSGIAIELSELGIDVNITHPIIQEGFTIIHSRSKFMAVPISTEIGTVEIYISLEKNNQVAV